MSRGGARRLGWEDSSVGGARPPGPVVYPNRGITSTITAQGGLGFILVDLGV
jgi:hypothetical protein